MDASGRNGRRGRRHCKGTIRRSRSSAAWSHVRSGWVSMIRTVGFGRFTMKRYAQALLAAAVVLAMAGPAHAGTLDTVKQRGSLNCGANGQLPGFGLPDAQGNWTGFDVDYCRALAATIFNDPT